MINGWTYEDLKNFWTEFGLNNVVGDDFISQWLLPGAQQEREWSQQMISTMYQNEWTSEGAKLDRMKAAGINPYIAAQGIAGGSSGGVAGAPPSAVGSGAKSLEALANAGIGITNAATGGFSSVVSALDLMSTNPSRISQLDADSKSKLASAGFDDAATIGLLIDNRYKNENWLLQLNTMRQNIYNMQAEWQYINVQKDYVQKQVDWYDKTIQSTLDLNESQRLLNEKQKFYVDEMGKAQQMENAFFSKWWSHSDSPAGVALKNLWLKAVDSGDMSLFTKGFDAYLDYCQQKAYNEYEGQLKSTENHTYAIENARANGQNVSDVLYGRIGSWGDAIGRAANIIGGNLQNLQDGIVAAFKKGDTKQESKEIRNTISNLISDCYEKREAASDNDKVAIDSCIAQLTSAMHLSDKELIEWYKKSFK